MKSKTLGNPMWINNPMVTLEFNGHGPKEGDLGIELEIEGAFPSLPQNSKFWVAKQEGSLRGGIEFITRNVVHLRQLDTYLEKLDGYLKYPGADCAPSIRCSTHIHINASHLTYYEFYNFLFYYYLIEDALVATQGHMRKGNLFCLRMSDAEQIFRALNNSIKSRSGPYAFDQQSSKYSALNLAVFNKLGSVEFRFLRPILDMKLLKMWCENLHRLVNVASKIPFHRSLSAVDALPSASDFLGMVFPNEFVEYVRHNQHDSPLSMAKLTKNYDHLLSMSKTLKIFARYSFGPELDYDEEHQSARKTWGIPADMTVQTFNTLTSANLIPTPPPAPDMVYVDDVPETPDWIDDD